MGAVVELCHNANRPGLEWILRIQNPTMLTTFEVAVPARDSALDWMTAIKETVKNASVRVSVLGLDKCFPGSINSFNEFIFLMFLGESNQRKGKSLEDCQRNVKFNSLLQIRRF